MDLSCAPKRNRTGRTTLLLSPRSKSAASPKKTSFAGTAPAGVPCCALPIEDECDRHGTAIKSTADIVRQPTSTEFYNSAFPSDEEQHRLYRAMKKAEIQAAACPSDPALARKAAQTRIEIYRAYDAALRIIPRVIVAKGLRAYPELQEHAFDELYSRAKEIFSDLLNKRYRPTTTSLQHLLSTTLKHELAATLRRFIATSLSSGSSAVNAPDKFMRELVRFHRDSSKSDPAHELSDRKKRTLQEHAPLLSSVVSINAPQDPEQDDSNPFEIPDTRGTPDFTAATSADRETITKLLHRGMRLLTAREAETLVRRFGLNGSPLSSVDDLAAEFAVSRETIRNYVTRAIDKLNGFLRSSLCDTDYHSAVPAVARMVG